MEKLIELLNEFAHTYADHYDDTGEEIECKFLYHTDQCFTYEEEGKSETLVDDVVISKRYGFIKWLVDNDKIDRLTFCTVETPSSKYEDFDLGPETPREDYTNILLMDLAIQDNPIEFLISILK